MELMKEQRLAICRVLLDVMDSMDSHGNIGEARHYPALHKIAHLLECDWEESRSVSVLATLAILKELHYKMKMMIGLVVYDLYMQEPTITYQQRVSFDILMGAIDWRVSFTEIAQLP